jgi:hypothetical protein
VCHCALYNAAFCIIIWHILGDEAVGGGRAVQLTVHVTQSGYLQGRSSFQGYEQDQYNLDVGNREYSWTRTMRCERTESKLLASVHESERTIYWYILYFHVKVLFCPARPDSPPPKKNHSFLKGSQTAPSSPSGKSNVLVKGSMEHLWNDTGREKQKYWRGGGGQ